MSHPSSQCLHPDPDFFFSILDPGFNKKEEGKHELEIPSSLSLVISFTKI